MTECATSRYCFTSGAGLPLEAGFDGGRVTSDGGLPWLAEAEAATGICAAFAAQIKDWRRRGRVRHSLETLVRQRVFQIACGYEDQNDANTLRHDPLLKWVCDRLPDSDPDLASQPTLSRLENAVDRKACYRLAVALVNNYVRQRQLSRPPKHILLDLDSTADATYGEQEGTAYHGYYNQHMYHPLLIFDGDTDQLITAVLRPGNAHASHGAIAVLRRLVRLLRQRWAGVTIEIRADSGFAMPSLYQFCEDHGIGYTIGLITNPRLEAIAAPLLAQAKQQRAASDAQKVRLADEAFYQADSWPLPRRVVFKAEALPKGPNTRFVVTNRTEPPLALYNWYVERGKPEQWIKDLKLACFADRLSCHRFLANQFRLLLHAAAYWLLDTLRRWLREAGVPPMQLDSLRLRLLKIGGLVRQLLTRVRLRLATSHPGEPLYLALATHRQRFVNNSG